MTFNYLVNVQINNNPFGALGASASVFENHLTGINKGIGALNQSFQQAQQRGTSAFGGILDQAKGLVGTFAVLGAAKSMIGFTASMEQTHLAFDVLLKDSDKANTMLTQLNHFADVTPYSNDEVIKSGKSLLAFGFTADSIMPKLTMLGDLASGLNIPFGELTTAFGKMKAKGKIQAEELNVFLERGINILPQLAKQMKVAEGSIFELASKGGVQFKDLDLALTNLAKNDFGGLMEKQSHTLGGQWSTLIGQVQQLGLAIGNELLPFAKSLVSDFLSPSVSFLQQHSSLMLTLGKTVLGLSIGYKALMWYSASYNTIMLIGNELILFRNTALFFGGGAYGVWTAATILAESAAFSFNTTLKALNLTFLANPIFLGIAAGIAFGYAIEYAWNKSETFRATLYGVWEAIKEFGNAVMLFAIKPLFALGEIIVGVFTTDFALIQKGIRDGADALVDISTNYYTAGQKLGNAFTKGWNDGKNDFNNIHGAQSIVETSALGKYYDEKDGGGLKPKGAKPADLTGGKADGINGGGRKVTTINIDLQNLIGQLTIQSTTITEGAQQAKEILIRELLQVINGANQIQL